MTPRPLIGITTYHRDGGARPSFSLPSAYVDALRLAGGLPLLLPPGEDRPEELLDHLDGLVFGGGGDLDPALLGGEPHETNYAVSRERDEFELALMRAVLESELPTLAICRGMQVLNVVLGGELHAHLPDVVGEAVPHRESREQHTRHPVSLEPGSRLAGIYRARALDVASWHHQGVARPGQGLVPAAWAPDGTIEGLEAPERPWLIAVQWHPELDREPDSPQRRLFRALVESAGRR